METPARSQSAEYCPKCLYSQLACVCGTSQSPVTQSLDEHDAQLTRLAKGTPQCWCDSPADSELLRLRAEHDRDLPQSAEPCNYREENDQVILTMSREDYDKLFVLVSLMEFL